MDQKKTRNKRSNTRTMLVEWSATSIKAINSYQDELEEKMKVRYKKPEVANMLMEHLLDKKYK